MRRVLRTVLAAALTATLITVNTGVAAADHNADDWSTDEAAEEWRESDSDAPAIDDQYDDTWTEDDWYDDQYDDTWTEDDWYDDQYDDTWTEDDWYDDQYDDTWTEDDWYDDQYDDTWTEDDWYDDQYDDTWTEDDWYDDQYDDTWTEDDWYDDQYDDTWTEDDWYDDQYDDIAAESVTSMIDAIDACFVADDFDFGWCILDAIDAFLLDSFEDPGPYVDDDGDTWVEDDDFSDYGDEPYDDVELEPVDDPTAASEILARFNELIPAEWRERIVDFALESDGRDGIVAAVEPVGDDLSMWTLYVDPADADYELDSTLIHEFAHVMTLNESQVDAVFAYSDQEYDRAVAGCATYFTGEGCALTDSYIAQFVDAFWDPIQSEFDAIDGLADDDAWEDAMFEFFEEHSDEFVTDYAVTNPAEDMAETFAAFVLAPELPAGDTIAEQKVLFFAQFEELMALRESIRRAI